jgi:acetyltransferase-like isoleucine patch superfamily enzyme
LKKNRFKKGLAHPILAYYYLKSLVRGFFYKIKYKNRASIGSNFRVIGKLSIKGPGFVSIGNGVTFDGTSNAITPWTYSKEAKISIGDNVFLNGTRFGCKARIDIGNECIIADCRILDTDHHSVIPSKRNDPTAIKTSPIKIGNRVWIALDSVVLKGVTIGDNSTITAKSVVTSDIPPNCIFGGNPARLIRALTKDEIE